MSLNEDNKARFGSSRRGVSHKPRESYMAINLSVKHGRLSCNEIIRKGVSTEFGGYGYDTLGKPNEGLEPPQNPAESSLYAAFPMCFKMVRRNAKLNTFICKCLLVTFI